MYRFLFFRRPEIRCVTPCGVFSDYYCRLHPHMLLSPLATQPEVHLSLAHSVYLWSPPLDRCSPCFYDRLLIFSSHRKIAHTYGNECWFPVQWLQHKQQGNERILGTQRERGTDRQQRTGQNNTREMKINTGTKSKKTWRINARIHERQRKGKK